jgi:enamine deaminase RidA (YjgF/YER057c/UK114 family)
MTNIVRIVTNGRRGRAAIYNGTVFIGGTVAEDRTQDIRGQMMQIVAKIDEVLAQAGTEKSRLLTVQIWMKNIIEDFNGMNEVWDSWIDPDEAPARATAQCEMGASDILVEVVVTAASSQ